MLEKLSREQEMLMEDVRNEWLERFFSHDFDEEKAKQLIDYLYELAGLDKPLKIVLDSPFALQIACNLVRAQVTAQVWDQVTAQVWDQVTDQVTDQELKYFHESYYSRCDDYGWISFYDFFERIIVVQHEKFKKLKELVKCNLFTSIQLEKLCLICRPPRYIKRDRRGNLHCTDGFAIEFKDGYGQHYLWGVYFAPQQFEKYVLDKVAAEEIFAVKNQEQKAALIKLYGYEKLLASLPSLRMIDRLTKKGKEHILYEFKLDNVKPRFLMVEDFSTARCYSIGVPSECRTVLSALAWTFDVRDDEYAKLVIET